MSLKQILRNHSFFIILSFLIIVMLISLGTWQMVRHKQKTAYVSMVESQMNQPAVKLQTLLNEGMPIENYKFRKVVVTGILDLEHINYLQAQVRDGKLGVNLILPLNLSEGTVILVNLGWVHKDKINKLHLEHQQMTIEGYLKVSDKPNRFTPDNQIPNAQLYYVNLTEFAKTNHIPTLLPLYLVATDFQPNIEDLRHNESSMQFQNVHFTYALTWYAMGIAWIVLVWLYQRRKYLKQVNSLQLNELTLDENIVSK